MISKHHDFFFLMRSWGYCVISLESIHIPSSSTVIPGSLHFPS